MALESLFSCACSSEPSLFNNAISSKISYSGLYVYMYMHIYESLSVKYSVLTYISFLYNNMCICKTMNTMFLLEFYIIFLWWGRFLLD